MILISLPDRAAVCGDQINTFRPRHCSVKRQCKLLPIALGSVKRRRKQLPDHHTFEPSQGSSKRAKKEGYLHSVTAKVTHFGLSIERHNSHPTGRCIPSEYSATCCCGARHFRPKDSHDVSSAISSVPRSLQMWDLLCQILSNGLRV